jgi:ATP-dependent DNA ligase
MSNQLVQLALDWRGTLPPGGAMAEQKFDGFRAARFAGIDGKVRLWTRGGMPIDGEFQVAGTLDATKRWCESGWKFGGEAGIYHVFDAMPFSAWRVGGDPTPLYQRKARLKALVEACAEPEWDWRPGSKGRDEGAIPVSLVEDEWVFDAADVIEAARRVWAAGGEGCMIKNAEAPYQRKRSGAWLKVKQCNISKWRMAA